MSKFDITLANARRKVGAGINTAIDAYIARLYKWPSVFMSIGLLICILILLPVGHIDPDNLVQEVETLISPTGSTSLKQKEELLNLFGDRTPFDFLAHQKIKLGNDLIVIYKVPDGSNVLTLSALDNITMIHNYIMNNITISISDITYSHSDLCAKINSDCSVLGDFVLKSNFRDAVMNNNVSCPFYSMKAVKLDDMFGDQSVHNGSLLISGTTLKLRYLLKNDVRSTYWVRKAISTIYESDEKKVYTYFRDCADCSRSISVYMSPSGLTRDEVYSDFHEHDLTIMLPISFWLLILMLVFGTGLFGIIINGLMVAGTWGILSFAGHQIVSMLALVLVFMTTKGTCYMLRYDKDTEEEYLREWVSELLSGIVFIIIFAVGISSDFYTVRLMSMAFCLSMTILLLLGLFVVAPVRVLESKYLCNMVDRKIQSMKRLFCFLGCYSFKFENEIKRDIGEKEESEIEDTIFRKLYKFVRYADTTWLPNLDRQQKRYVKYARLSVSLLLFLTYVSIAIAGLFQNHMTPNLCALSDPDEPYGKFCVVNEKYYESDMWVTMVIKHKQPFDFQSSYSKVNSLLNIVHRSGQVKADRTINWMHDYSSFKQSDPSLVNFVDKNILYKNDILVKQDNISVTTSRIYLRSVDISTTDKAYDLVAKLRDVQDDSSSDVYFYAPEFPLYEGYLANSLDLARTVGIAGVIRLIVLFFGVDTNIWRTTLVILLPVWICILGVIGIMYFRSLPLIYLNSMTILLAFSFVAELAISFNRKSGRIFLTLVMWFIGLFFLVIMLIISNVRSYILEEVFMPQILFIFLGLLHFKVFVPHLIMTFIPLHVEPDEVELVTKSVADVPAKNGFVEKKEIFENNFDHRI